MNLVKLEIELYNKRLNGNKFNHLWKYIVDDENIKEALKKIRDNGDKSTGPDNIGIKNIVSDDFKKTKKEVLMRLYGKRKCKCREVSRPKPNGKTRTLGIGNYYDRIAQQCVANILIPILEVDFHPHSYGFRKNMNSKHCIANIYSSMPSTGYIYDCDLKSYFDSVKLDLVLDKLRNNHGIKDTMVLKAIKRLMWQDTVKPHKNKYKGIGLKQGSILGPLLGNVMLNELDWIISDKADEPYKNGRTGLNITNIFRKSHAKALRTTNNGQDLIKFKKFLRDRLNIKMIRYADDFILISKTEYELNEGIKVIEDWMKANCLEINKDKTKILTIEENVKLKFLGYNLRFTEIRNNGRRGIIISPKDSKELWKETKESVNNSIFTNRDKLGLFLRGKLEYYSICTNMGEYLNKIHRLALRYGNRSSIKSRFELIEGNDNYRVKLLGNEYNIWDMRRHSKDSVKDYISTMKVFWNPNENNEEEWLSNYYNIKNYESINSGNVIYVKSLIKQFKREPILGIPYIYINPRNLEIHHIKQRRNGGLDEYSNLLLLHKESHKLIHNTNYEIKGNYKEVNMKNVTKYRKKL